MDRRERYLDPQETQWVALRRLQSRMWASLPGIVQSYNADEMTVTVQPSVNGIQRAKDGTDSSLQMPLLLDVPVVWQGGGGVTAVFPIAKGDECLVVFSSRCIDGWWSQGGVQDPPDLRMHNLSDGFAFVGVRSKPRAFTPPAGVAALMSDDGSTFLQLDPAAQTIKATAPGGVTVVADGGCNVTTTSGNINLNGVTIDSDGNVVAPGTVKGTDFIQSSDSTAFSTHTHPTAGTGAPSPPTPGS
jgi:hypothetical protein